jgi:hypothetical protein
MSKIKDPVDEKLWSSWAAGYTAGGKIWRTTRWMRCPRRCDKRAFERGWLEGKTERAAITAKQQEQYRWRAAAFSSGTQAEQIAAKAKADQLEAEIKAMLVARRGARDEPNQARLQSIRAAHETFKEADRQALQQQILIENTAVKTADSTRDPRRGPDAPRIPIYPKKN